MTIPTIRLLKQHVAERAAAARVADVRLGLGYTAVSLDDESTGVAFTFREAFNQGCTVFKGRTPLAGQNAHEMIGFAESENPLEAAVGLAAINALANRLNPGLTTGDILEEVDLRPADHVGMVGFFAPVLPKLKQRGHKVSIFELVERADAPSGQLMSQNEAFQRLPECQVALITATSLINHTFDDLMTAVVNCREVVVLGASTPLCPEVFAAAPVTLLSGVVVEQTDALLAVVSEGGGMRRFRSMVRKVNCRVPSSSGMA